MTKQSEKNVEGAKKQAKPAAKKAPAKVEPKKAAPKPAAKKAPAKAEPKKAELPRLASAEVGQDVQEISTSRVGKVLKTKVSDGVLSKVLVSWEDGKTCVLSSNEIKLP